MMRTILLAGSFLLTGSADRLVAQAPDLDLRFQPGARVEILSAQVGSSWVTGQVGRLGKCAAVSLPQGTSDPSSRFFMPLTAVDSLRVSSIYDGRPDPDGRRRVYRPGGSLSGEQWIPVSPEELEAAAEAAAACLAQALPPGDDP